MNDHSRDQAYQRILLDAIAVCTAYKPRMGRRAGAGHDLASFQSLYRSDPFYNWLGLDNPLMYTAHRTAGSITSLYRQIGLGCERLFRQILTDALRLQPEDVVWSYRAVTESGRARTLHLDARIPTDAIGSADRRATVRKWIGRAASDVGVAPTIRKALTGVVFEVRQGYKSKDSKRQNADIANAATAYAKTYLPCLVLFSNQIDEDVESRYRMAQWQILKGSTDVDDDVRSVYAFATTVLKYDLAGFFERNAEALRSALDGVLRSLLDR